MMRDWLLEVTAHREADAFDRAIDLRVTRLRRKVEIDPAHPEAIQTVRGVGYMFVPPQKTDQQSRRAASAYPVNPVTSYRGASGARNVRFGSRAEKLRVGICSPNYPR